MTRTNFVLALALVAIAASWGFAVVFDCWFAGDHMIGFSPFIFMGFPFAAFVLIIGLTLATLRKSILLTTATVLAFLLASAPIFFMQEITEFAWHSSLRKYSSSNQTALKDTNFSGAQLDDGDFPADHRMVPIDGFIWYCEQHHAAPNGNFRGFSYNSIPHVYVNKIRHGFRGVAWIEDPEKIPSTSDYEYFQTPVDDWYIWEYGE